MADEHRTELNSSLKHITNRVDPLPILVSLVTDSSAAAEQADVDNATGTHILQEPSDGQKPLPDTLAERIHDLDLKEEEHNVASTTEPSLPTDPDTIIAPEQQTSQTIVDVDLARPCIPGRKSKNKRVSITRPQGVSNESIRGIPSSSVLKATTGPALDIMSMPMRPTSLLVASLGNPPPYHSTRHSAAHLILRHLQASMNLPHFTSKSKPYGGGHISVGAEAGRPAFTLYQSSVQMNVSGPPLLKAWKHFAGLQDVAARTPGLVVLHDEMETQPGSIKVRRGNGSAKGHNGIKSVQQSFSGGGLLDSLGDRFVRIGVGIGRPAGGSRTSNDVSAYVLGQLTAREKDGLESAASQVESVLYQELARIGQS
ncbi:hypothetical protein LTR05_006749 [Lithohypha guttulata]|uniref:peptidyl-tRNA hydrolase n=1 Tax=Lithohypha guttulata TaxID=1690604 RepID=A0AAN7YEP3_9EURO|nr:hypothetical protein LTR05_006749 [Lithohypha guttulata]